MINLKKTLTYKELLKNADKEHLEMIKKHAQREKIILNDDLKSLNKLKEKRNLVVFTLPRCEDAATTIPFLFKLEELNKNISIRFMNREGNEELLKELTGESKVPTIVSLDEENTIRGKYIEYPESIKEKLHNKNDEEREYIITEFREEKYNKEIQRELIELILK